MNPDHSEWMQPIRPLRISFKLPATDTLKEKTVIVQIFAVRTRLDDTEYLTIDGTFVLSSSKHCLGAETLIDGKWTHLQ